MNWEQIELFEEWRQVVGYEGYYEVSNFGRVRSVADKWRKGKLLRLHPHKGDGYLQTGLSINKRLETKRVHRLVAEAFLGPCPLGKQVDHIDGDRTNNVVLNLRYVTRLQNRRAAVERRGEWAQKSRPPAPRFGQNNAATKLTNQQVVEIRRLVLEGMTQRSVAREFDVSTSAIWLIVHGKNHKTTT